MPSANPIYRLRRSGKHGPGSAWRFCLWSLIPFHDLVRKIGQHFAGAGHRGEQADFFETVFLCGSQLVNDLVRRTHDARTLNGFGRDKAPLLGHQKRAVAIVNLEIAFLRRGLHFFHIGAVFVPNIVDGRRNHLFSAGEFIDFIGKVQDRRHP